ncbi:MAG: IS21 family transposase [Bacteroidales bacterium]|nr:IS21 family transposase [Bacteroidales bacterium]
MAGKIKPMSQIKQLLLLHQQGKKIKFIARTLGMSKNTVKSYLSKIVELKLTLEHTLSLEDPALELQFSCGNPAYKDERFEYIKSQLDYYQAQLKQNGVTRKLLWEEYLEEVPSGYGLTQFCFHLNQQLLARNPTMVLPHEPGEELFVDFAGKKLPYIDRETGELIYCPVFVACLPFSDYAFVMVVRSQCIDDFIYALKRCLEFIGGCPRVLVPDNFKSAIIKANRYEPDVTRALEDFCNHYKITVLPARVAKPKDKALVENQVKLIYTRVFARLRKQQFFDLISLNEAVLEKGRRHNQTRMQKKPYCREERFLSVEKKHLSPLPAEGYELKYYRELKVAMNNHIYLTIDKHYYSVPFKWIGERVKVIYTRSIVRIYVRGEMISIHPRDYTPGGYSTIIEHLCSHHQHYLQRSPAYYMQRAEKISAPLLQLIQCLFDGGRPPEQNYRTCDGLLNIYRKTTPEIFNHACKLALDYKCYSYRYILNMVEKIQKHGFQEIEKSVPLPIHENIRGRDYYNQLSLNL